MGRLEWFGAGVLAALAAAAGLARVAVLLSREMERQQHP